MNVHHIAELAREQMRRDSVIRRAAPEPLAAAPDEIPEPAVGQVYRDGFSLGFTWRIQWVDGGQIFMRLYSPEGEQTDSYLKFPPERWTTFFERQRLSLLDP